MVRALLASVYYVLISMLASFRPALAVGLLVHLVVPEWEVIAFGVVFGYVIAEFLLQRKGKWLS